MRFEKLYHGSFRHFLRPIVGLLDDPEVSEILVNGASSIYAEKRGKLLRTPVHFETEDDLQAAVQHLAQFLGKRVGPDSPILEGRLPDGSRVEAIVPPIAQAGTHLAIRRFRSSVATLESLVAYQTIDSAGLALCRSLVQGRRNILVSGGTSTGKTSLLNALSCAISPDERVIVIEDAKELMLQNEHVVSLESRESSAEGAGGVSIRDLFRASLRMRPDRLVVGELRGGEAFDLVQAMNSGHGGCMTTLHASSPLGALYRLESLALMSGVELPLPALRSQLVAAIDVVMQIERQVDGRRVLTHCVELVNWSAEESYTFRSLQGIDHGQ